MRRTKLKSIAHNHSHRIGHGTGSEQGRREQMKNKSKPQRFFDMNSAIFTITCPAAATTTLLLACSSSVLAHEGWGYWVLQVFVTSMVSPTSRWIIRETTH